MTADPTYAGLSLQDVDGFLDPVIVASGKSGAWESDPQTVRALAHCCLYLRRACGDLADRVRVLENEALRQYLDAFQHFGNALASVEARVRVLEDLVAGLGPRDGPPADAPCEPPPAAG